MSPLEHARMGHAALRDRKARQAALALAELAQASVERALAELSAQRTNALDDAGQRLAKMASRPMLPSAPRIAPRRVASPPAPPVARGDSFVADFTRRFL